LCEEPNKISSIALEETCGHEFVGGLLLWTEKTPPGAFVCYRIEAEGVTHRQDIYFWGIHVNY
jgi:hypothetical protein